MKELEIDELFEEFILSRKAMNVTKSTIQYYNNYYKMIKAVMDERGLKYISDITPSFIRSFIVLYKEKGSSDSYVHAFARIFKTLTRFAHEEGYIEKVPKFTMPKLAKKQLPTLTIAEVRKLYKACETDRDRAILLLAVDTGLRRSEIINLNWGDLDVKVGSLMVRAGKGNKDRVVATGAKVRQSLMKYWRTLEKRDKDDPMFQIIHGTRFTDGGLRSVFVRLQEDTGIKFSAHALRRTFAKMSVKSGRSIIYIQQLMGHSNIETTRNYIQNLDWEDIIEDHEHHGFVDNLF